LLCGDRAFVEAARKWRKMVGGGMRQVGVLAAAGIVALNTTIERLTQDHANARSLADGLSRIPGIAITAPVPTNIVMFEVVASVTGNELVKEMGTRGVLLSHRGGQQFRAVTHRMVSSDDVADALDRLAAYLKGRVSNPPLALS
jgi:threonine aldolase